MSNKLYEENSIKAIAEAIRSRSGKTGLLSVKEMANAILYDITPTPLCLIALAPNSSVTLQSGEGGATWSNGKYSLDNNTWQNYTLGTTITLANKGDRVYFSNLINSSSFWPYSSSCYLQFVLTGELAASGCISSLYGGTTIVTTLASWPHCFYKLFCNCTALKVAPALPATILSEGCYGEMFENCTSLTMAPHLPATTLASSCYDSMFCGCSSLVEGPVELPATTLANYCYQRMFEGCESLLAAPRLPATILTLGCYADMFTECTSLTTVPALPATILAEDCYLEMFNYCTSLQVSDTQIAEASIAWTIPTSGTFSGSNTTQSWMFNECAGTRSSNDLVATVDTSKTYYTQNTPIV